MTLAEASADFLNLWQRKLAAEFAFSKFRHELTAHGFTEQQVRETAGVYPIEVKAPIAGELVLAGTMHVSDEILTGVFIRMTLAELQAVKFLPMYRRVVVTEELT